MNSVRLTSLFRRLAGKLF